MTHPKEAVESVARALAAEDYVIPILSHHTPEHQADYRKSATALLDQIAPLYREQAARIADRRVDEIVRENGSWEPDTNVTNLPEWAETACDELEYIAAAIRKGE